MNEIVQKLVNDLSNQKEVEAILLGGSYGAKTNDENSDYDIYVYLNSRLDASKRKSILEKYYKYIEIANTYFEEEDDGVLTDGTEVELIYRDCNFFDGMLNNTINNCMPCIGYSTCFCFNLINSIILYDANGKLEKIQNKYNVPYPDKLQENIIKKNYELIKEKMPAYYYQIKKAIGRDDYVSVNHRVSALLASYFDIIFAKNKFWHPGEKKIIKIIKEKQSFFRKSF